MPTADSRNGSKAYAAFEHACEGGGVRNHETHTIKRDERGVIFEPAFEGIAGDSAAISVLFRNNMLDGLGCCAICGGKPGQR